MSESLQVRSNPVREFPTSGDEGYGSEATALVKDLVNAVNSSLESGAVKEYTTIVGDAADVIANKAKYSDIQTAIDALSDGDSMLILPRTFTLSTKLLINKRLDIDCSGYDTVLQDAAGIVSGEMIEVSVAGVILEKLRIKQASGTPDYAIAMTAAGDYAFLNKIWFEGSFAIDNINDLSGTTSIGFAQKI